MYFNKNNKETKQRFTIRKYSLGVASVLIGTLSMAFPQAAHASQNVSPDAVSATLSPDSSVNETIDSQPTVTSSEVQTSESSTVSEPTVTSSEVQTSESSTVSEPTVTSSENQTSESSILSHPPVGEEPEIGASSTVSDFPENFKELSEEEQLEIMAELGLSEEDQAMILAELDATGEESGSDTTGAVPDDHKVAIDDNRVIHEPYVEVTGAAGNNFVNVTATHLDTLKTLNEATIYFEYKSMSNLAGIYELYTVSSKNDPNREYFTILYDNGVVKVYGRNADGSFYKLSSGILPFNENRWNNMAFTIKPLEGESGTASLFVNGVESATSVTPRGGLFIKDIPTVDTVRIGQDAAGYNGGRSFVVKDFSVYNKALTKSEIEKRSEHISKEVLKSEIESNTGLSSKEMVYESAFNHEAQEKGVKSFRAPTLLKTKNGTILAFSAAHPRHHIDWGDINSVVKRSEDGGKTWSDFKPIVALPENPVSAANQNAIVVSPFTIDTSVVQDEKTGRIFVIMDMFKQGQGVFDIDQDYRPGYTTIDGVSYLNLYKTKEDQTPHTVRNGRVYTPDGKETAYTVITPELSQKADRSDIGTIFENGKEIGNIYFTEKTTSPFTTVQSSSTWLVTSDDDGKTWSAPTDITAQVKKPWMDLLLVAPNAGTQLQNGRLLIPIYTSNKENRHGSWGAATIYSDDNGQTWHYGESIKNYTDVNGQEYGADFYRNPDLDTTESSLVQLNSGKVLMFARIHSGGKFVMGTSTDNGETWQDNFKLWEELPDFRVQPSAAHYTKDGKEYVLAVATAGRERQKGTIFLFEVKENDAIEFVKSKVVEKGNFTYSSLEHVGNGEFHLLYENADPGYDLFSIQHRKFTFDWLMKDNAETDEVVKIVSIKQREDGNYDVVFDHYVTPTIATILQLSDGTTLQYVGQTELNTLVFSGNPTGKTVQVSGLTGVESQSLLPFDVVGKSVEQLIDVPYKVIEETVATLKKGERRIRMIGQNGQLSKVVVNGFDTVTGQFGELVLSEKLLKAAVDQIVEVGTLEQDVPNEAPMVAALPEIVIAKDLPSDPPSVEPKPEIVIAKAIPSDAPIAEALPEVVIAKDLPSDAPSVDAKPEVVIAKAIPLDAPMLVEKSELEYPKAVPSDAPITDKKPELLIGITESRASSSDDRTILVEEIVNSLESQVVYSRVQRKQELLSKSSTNDYGNHKILPQTGEASDYAMVFIGGLMTSLGIGRLTRRRNVK